MKFIAKPALTATLFAALLLALTTTAYSQDDKKRGLDPAFAKFVQAKKAQARAMAVDQHLNLPAEVSEFFEAVEQDEYSRATNVFGRLGQKSGRTGGQAANPDLRSKVWQPMSEVEGAYEQFHGWDSNLLHEFGDSVMKTIPRDAIYFGGTDPGRFVISALCESQMDGKPFFTITQNQLADSTYLDYLREIYGRKIHLPSTNDLSRCFEEYMSDVQRRYAHDNDPAHASEPRQMKPGENITPLSDGRVTVSGDVSVMAINGLLARVIFDANPDREFFVEESFPLDWMYPHLVPDGFILKLNRKPPGTISDEIVSKDHEFWSRLVNRLTGLRINYDTPVKDICGFAERTYLRKELAGFEGDPKYAKNEEAQKTISKLRTAIAGTYVWRTNDSKNPADGKRMSKEADLAYRQAFALCPYSPEAVFRYVQILAKDGRIDDALLIAETAAKFDFEQDAVRSLAKQLKAYKDNIAH